MEDVLSRPGSSFASDFDSIESRSTVNLGMPVENSVVSGLDMSEYVQTLARNPTWVTRLAES